MLHSWDSPKQPKQMAKYRFKDEQGEHLHQLKVGDEWKNLTGTTTVLGVIAKPALIPWAAKMTTEYIRENISKYDLKDPVQFEQLLLEAKSAHRKRKEKAGDWGKNFHGLIEGYIKGTIEHGIELFNEDNVDQVLRTFHNWTKSNNVKFEASEKNVYSEQMWIGGIVDFVCEIDGSRWIGDIKTSNSGIHPENFWQCASYDLMLQEMGEPKADGYLILNLKENGEFNEKRSIDLKENQEAFKSCLNIYRTLEKINNTIL